MNRCRNKSKSRNRSKRKKRLEKSSFGLTAIGLTVFTGIFAGGVLIAFRYQPVDDVPALPDTEIARAPSASSQYTESKVRPVKGAPVLKASDPLAANKYESASPSINSGQFVVCGKVRVTCVVDGDTFWLDGTKIRVADIDTPEIGQPACDAEYQLGMEATNRFMDLLNQGPFQLLTAGDRDQDQYGRKLRVVVRQGRSIGDQLVSEGLAHRWIGHKEPWC